MIMLFVEIFYQRFICYISYTSAKGRSSHLYVDINAVESSDTRVSISIKIVLEVDIFVYIC